MMQKALYIVYTFIAVISLAACANIRGLSGGKADTEGPKIDDKRYSTPNKLTNFKEKEIILTFDEWIKLEQAQTRVLISPPLKEKPIIKLKNRSVVIKFQEELMPNTTYTINLADAVKDITEGNIVENFNYVFSTGEYLDSLKVEGNIVDALSGEPKDNVWVMLYDKLDDSIPALEKPYYLTKTKKDGSFLIENIKSGAFRIFALADKNNNYLYDPAGEEIAYWGEPFLVEDSMNQKFQLRMFLPKQELKLLSQRFANKGTMRFLFNTPIEDKTAFKVEPITLIEDFKTVYNILGDSVYMWFSGAMQADSSYQFLVNGKDTTALTWSPTLEALPKPKLVIRPKGAANAKSAGKAAGKAIGPVEPLSKSAKQPLELFVNAPLTNIDTTLIKIYKDSISESTFVENATFLVDSVDIQKISLNNNTLEGGLYQLVFLPNSLTNYFGEKNTDTLKQPFKAMKPNDFGRMEVIIKGLDSLVGQSLVLELYKGKDEFISKELVKINSTAELNFKYNELLPSTYFIRIIYDTNENGVWDTGSYWQKIEPEKILNSAPTQVRADWDNEMLIDLSVKTKGKKIK